MLSIVNFLLNRWSYNISSRIGTSKHSGFYGLHSFDVPMTM